MPPDPKKDVYGVVEVNDQDRPRMMPRSADLETGAIAREEAEGRIRAVIENELDALYRAIAVKVRAAFRTLPRAEVAERAYEVLDEAVGRALARPENLEPGRSAFPWLVGIAVKILMGQGREEARARRQVSGTDLGDESWSALLEGLSVESSDGTISDRIDLHEAMERLDPSSRLVLECRFVRGLDGAELAEAIGAASPDAARVRLCRALKKLRALLGLGGPEVNP